MKMANVTCIGCGHVFKAPRGARWPIPCARCTCDAAPRQWWFENGTDDDQRAIQRFDKTQAVPAVATPFEEGKADPSRIEELEAQLAAQDADIEDLKAALDLVQGERKRLEAQLAAQDAVIATLRAGEWHTSSEPGDDPLNRIVGARIVSIEDDGSMQLLDADGQFCAWFGGQSDAPRSAPEP